MLEFSARKVGPKVLAEEVLGEVHVALLVQRDVLEVHRGDLEHVTGALRVGFGDERGMEIDEALVVEELVDSEGHRVADAEDRTESVGPEAHVRDAPEILQRSILLLEREAHRVALADDLDLLGLDFHGLAAADGRDELALHSEGRAGGDALEELLVEELGIRHDLDIVDGGTVVEGDELHLPVASLRPDPTFGQHFAARLHPEQFLDLDSFHIRIRVNMQIYGKKPYLPTIQGKITKKQPRKAAFLQLFSCGLFSAGFSRSVHDLQRGAAAQLLLDIRHDTHSDVFVNAEVDGHQGTVGLGHGVTLGSDEVADVVDGLEGIVQLDTGIGTVHGLILAGRRPDVDVGGQVLALKLRGFGSHGELDDDLVLRLTHLGGHHEEEQEHEHDIGEGTRGNAGNALVVS